MGRGGGRSFLERCQTEADLCGEDPLFLFFLDFVFNSFVIAWLQKDASCRKNVSARARTLPASVRFNRPSLIPTNHQQSTQKHSQQKRSSLAQVEDCNQAHKPVFTETFFPSPL